MIERIKKQIIVVTCSKSLQKALQTTKFELTDFDLLLLAYEHAADYETRLNLLNIFAINTDDFEVRKQAELCISFEKDKLFRLMGTEQDCVFEIKIKETENSWEERYLAKTFSGALKKAEYFCKYYKDVFNVNARFKIGKRKVIDETSIQDFEEDCCGEATYNGKSVLLELWHRDLENRLLDGDNNCDDEERDCCDCKNKCFTRRIPKLPQFLKSFDIVCYNDYYGEKEYAVVFVWTTEKFDNDGCAYCIPLKADRICNGSIKSEKAFWDMFLNLHTHIEYPRIEIIQADDLPKDKRKAYEILMRLNEKFNKNIK